MEGKSGGKVLWVQRPRENVARFLQNHQHPGLAGTPGVRRGCMGLSVQVPRPLRAEADQSDAPLSGICAKKWEHHERKRPECVELTHF